MSWWVVACLLSIWFLCFIFAEVLNFEIMKIFRELSLTDFEPWGGACCRYEQLTNDELNDLETLLDDLYPNGIDETMLNDLFWFEFVAVCEWLGLECDEETDEIIRR